MWQIQIKNITTEIVTCLYYHRHKQISRTCLLANFWITIKWPADCFSYIFKIVACSYIWRTSTTTHSGFTSQFLGEITKFSWLFNRLSTGTKLGHKVTFCRFSIDDLWITVLLSAMINLIWLFMKLSTGLKKMKNHVCVLKVYSLHELAYSRSSCKRTPSGNLANQNIRRIIIQFGYYLWEVPITSYCNWHLSCITGGWINNCTEFLDKIL